MTEPHEVKNLKESTRFRQIFEAVRSEAAVKVIDVRIEKGARFEKKPRFADGGDGDDEVVSAVEVLTLSEAITLRNSLAQTLSDGQVNGHKGIGHIGRSARETPIYLAGAEKSERCFALSRVWKGMQMNLEGIQTISDIDPPPSVLTPESEPDGYRVLSFKIRLPGDEGLTPEHPEAAFDRCPPAPLA